MTTTTLKTRLRAVLIACTAGFTLAASAQGDAPFPTRQMTLINPYTAGSATDVMARSLAEQFTRALGQPMAVVVRDGASGVVGMQALTAAQPDGHTLAYTPVTSLVVQPYLVKDLKLSPDTVQPLCGVTENILAIAVRNDSPFKNVADLVAAAKQKSLAFGTAGPNSLPFLGVQQLAKLQKLELVHAPYKGDAAAVVDVVGGQVDFGAIVAASGSALVTGGRLRLLAVMSSRRHPGYPDVPTLRESGYDVLQNSYAGLFVPKGVPEPVLAKLDRACATALASDAVRQSAQTTHQVMMPLDRAAWTQRVQDEYRLMGVALGRP